MRTFLATGVTPMTMWGVNVFSSAPFLDTLAATYFAGRPAEIARFEVEGHVFQLLRVDGRKPITTWPLVDYWEPVGAEPEPGDPGPPGPAIGLRSLPRVALETIAVDGRPPDLGARSPSPALRFARFEDWPALRAVPPRAGPARRGRLPPLHAPRRTRARPGDAHHRRPRRRRGSTPASRGRSSSSGRAARLYRDARHARVPPGPARPRAWPRWRRSAPAAACSRCTSVSGTPAGSRRGSPPTTTPAVPTRPGRLLLEHLVQASYEQGDAEFDFLVGDEPYKWQYATHTRLVEPLGPQPRLPEATRRLRRRLRLGRKYLAVRDALGPHAKRPGG